jgi:hypothetical protein
MESKDILYGDLKSKLEVMDMPETLIFCGGSAYCKDVKKTVFEVLIPRIERLLSKERSQYENRDMVNAKERLFQIYVAVQDKSNCNISTKDWNEDHKFYSAKLSDK